MYYRHIYFCTVTFELYLAASTNTLSAGLDCENFTTPQHQKTDTLVIYHVGNLFIIDPNGLKFLFFLFLIWCTNTMSS